MDSPLEVVDPSNLLAQLPAQLGVGGELTVVEPLVPGGVVGEDRVLGGIRQKLVGHLRPQRCLGDVQVSTAGALAALTRPGT